MTVAATNDVRVLQQALHAVRVRITWVADDEDPPKKKALLLVHALPREGK